MRGNHQLDPSDVLAVDVRVQPPSIQLSGIRDPRDRIQTKFSIVYAVATAFVQGRPQLRHFEEQYVDDPSVRALMRRITLTPDPELDWNRSELRIATRDGQTLVHRVDLRGAWGDPVQAEEQLAEKYQDLAGLVLPRDRVERLAWLVGRLEQVEDVRELTREWAPHQGGR